MARAENAGRAFGPGGSPGSGPVVPGPCGAGRLPRSDGVTAGPVVPGRRFRGVLLPRQRPGQRAAQPAGRGPPLPRGQALLLQSRDKVGDAGAKARADFDIRWKSLPPATTGGGLGGGISRLMAIPGWIPGNPAGAGTPVRDRRQRILTPAWPRRPSPSWRLHGLGDDTRRLPGRGAPRQTGSTVSHTKGADVRVQSRPPAHTVDTTIFEMWRGSLSTRQGLSIPVV